MQKAAFIRNADRAEEGPGRFAHDYDSDGDPNKHTFYNCYMDARHVCALSNYSVSTNAIYRFQGPPSGPLPGDAGSTIHEELGQQLFAGLETMGAREPDYVQSWSPRK